MIDNNKFYLSRGKVNQIEAYLEACWPEEGCGLLGGNGRTVERVGFVENELHSPCRFRMKPEDQLKKFLQLEQAGLELAGIFHSHPYGPAMPSLTDIQEFLYPGVIFVIFSRETGQWEVNAYQIENETYQKIRLELD